MNIGKHLKPYVFVTLALGYIFLFFGSIYGLFVSEISIAITTDPQYHITLTGWAKNLTCIFGLLINASVPVYLIGSALYKAVTVK